MYTDLINQLTAYLNVNKKQHGNLLKWMIKLTQHALRDNSDSKKYFAYRRGDIVKVDFGFNVGSEIGGVHYAIVISKYDNFKSDIITVVPLSSKKPGKKLHSSEVDLGDFLTTSLFEWLDTHDRNIVRMNEHVTSGPVELKEFKKEFGSSVCTNFGYMSEKYPVLCNIGILHEGYSYQSLKSEISKIEKDLKRLIKSRNSVYKELSYLKTGSVAKIVQLTRISKRRILDPTNRYDALYKRKLYTKEMDLLNKKIKDTLIFDK